MTLYDIIEPTSSIGSALEILEYVGIRVLFRGRTPREEHFVQTLTTSIIALRGSKEIIQLFIDFLLWKQVFWWLDRTENEQKIAPTMSENHGWI